jgi:type I protein arginine methyltransferase
MSHPNQETGKDKVPLDYYFDSYSHYSIHEEMLKDQVRTCSYRNAILRNRHLFENKVVLDVGCGTGILCLFAAQAGARLVIGVDMSNMLERAREIVQANGFSSDRIVLLRGKMEEVKLPVDKVDVIVSEWMGYFLLYESMLDTVLYARDKYLVEGGLLFPDRATLHLAAIEDAQYKQEKVHFWDDVYGFDMSCMKEYVLREPLVDIVDSKTIVSSRPIDLFSIDLYTISKEQLAFGVPFALDIAKDDRIHALLSWFSVDFTGAGQARKPVSFGTGPSEKTTHWKQTVFYLPEDLEVQYQDVLSGQFSCRPNQGNPRELDIVIQYGLRRDGTSICNGQYEYHMS